MFEIEQQSRFKISNYCQFDLLCRIIQFKTKSLDLDLQDNLDMLFFLTRLIMFVNIRIQSRVLYLMISFFLYDNRHSFY